MSEIITELINETCPANSTLMYFLENEPVEGTDIDFELLLHPTLTSGISVTLSCVSGVSKSDTINATSTDDNLFLYSR